MLVCYSPFPSRSRHRTRGAVLLVVLWITVLLSVMIVGFAAVVQASLAQSSAAAERTQARALAEAAIYYAGMRAILPPIEDKLWPTNGTMMTIDAFDPPVQVSLRLSTGLINPNISSFEVWEALFIGLQMDASSASQLAKNIIDWHNMNSQDVAQRRLFMAPEELRQVRGMTEEIFQKVRGYISIQSRSVAINPESAPSDLLKTLLEGIGEDTEQLTEYLSERERVAQEGGQAPQFPYRNRIFMVSSGHGYEAEAVVPMPDGNSYKARATLLTDEFGQWARIQQWRDF